MLRAITTLAMAAGLVAATGCADVTSPERAWAESATAESAAARQGTLTFTSTQSFESGQAVSATGGTGSISFQGSLQTPNPCFDVTGALSERRSRITVTVTATSTGGICAQVITHNNYNGQVSGLAPGTYDFRIVHSTGGGSTTVLSQQVTVS